MTKIGTERRVCFFRFPRGVKTVYKIFEKIQIKTYFQGTNIISFGPFYELHNLYSIMHKTAKSYYENCPILFPCELIEPFFRHRHHAAHHGRHRTIHL